MKSCRLPWVCFAALSAIVLFSGCNKVRLGYEYGDWLLLFSVKSNFDPEKEQLERLKKDVEDYFRWNRREMLPRYADFLLRAADSLEIGIRPGQYDSAYGEYLALHRETLAPVADKAQVLLLSLTPGQIDAYLGRMEKKNGKLRKEYRKPRAKLLEQRYRKTVSGIEDWTGRLSTEQKSRVREWSYALPWSASLWLEHREKIQGRLAEILRGPDKPDPLRIFLEDYFLYPEKLRSPDFQAKMVEYEAGIKNFILGLHSILTPHQRNHVLKQVRELAGDFKIMSEKR